MPGSEKYFLGFNKDEIFKWILAAEGHFRYVTSENKSEDRACIVKHLAEVEGHSDEAVSHALIIQGEDVSVKYAKLRDMAKDLRKRVQTSQLSFSEGLIKIRSLRSYFESFNPDYDISKCSTCGPKENVYRIEKTLLMQSGNSFQDWNLGEMQRFKREKPLNYRQTSSRVGYYDMTKRNDVLGIYGAELVAKAAEMGFTAIDRSVGKLTAPIHERPSVWLNMIGGIGIPLVTLWRKVRAPWDLPLIAGGGHLFTKIVDYLREAISPGLGLGVTGILETPRIVYQPAAIVTAGGNQRVHTRAPTIVVGVGPSYSYAPYRGP